MTGLIQRQGKIHNLGRAGGGEQSWALPERKKPSRMIPLLLVLPMFAQIFHYMIDINSLYLLSKAWAVLMLPLALYAIFGLRTRFAVVYLMVLIYVMGVT